MREDGVGGGHGGRARRPRQVRAPLPPVLHKDARAGGQAARRRVERRAHERVAPESEAGKNADCAESGEEELHAAPLGEGQARRPPVAGERVHVRHRHRHQAEAQVLQRSDDAVRGAERLRVDHKRDRRPDDGRKHAVARAQAEQQQRGGEGRHSEREVHQRNRHRRPDTQRRAAAAAVDAPAEQRREHRRHREGFAHYLVGLGHRLGDRPAKGLVPRARLAAVDSWWVLGRPRAAVVQRVIHPVAAVFVVGPHAPRPEEVSLEEQRGRNIVEGQHARVDGDAAGSEAPERPPEAAHRGERDGSVGGTALCLDAKPRADRARAAAVDAAQRESAEEGEGEECGARPKRGVHRAEGGGEPWAHQVVDDRAEPSDGEGEAEGEGELLVVEPAGDEGALRHRQRLPAQPEDCAADEHPVEGARGAGGGDCSLAGEAKGGEEAERGGEAPPVDDDAANEGQHDVGQRVNRVEPVKVELELPVCHKPACERRVQGGGVVVAIVVATHEEREQREHEPPHAQL
mmetsp:Transcript_39743/g.127766  ORF Transcript_39743/g.127766 Transcript_39743/m.127766 type:complete len:517 (+) Transcript_39743:476-2026(+)